MNVATLGSFYLPLDAVNRADAIASKAGAVLDLLIAVNADDVSTDTVSNAAWILTEMVNELKEIANLKEAQA